MPLITINAPNLNLSKIKFSHTTVNGLISAGIAITIAILDLPPKAKYSVIIAAVARAVIGWYQKDCTKECNNGSNDGNKSVKVDQAKS